MLIRDAYTGWPWCTHDARKLRNSSLFDKAENGQNVTQGKLVGHSLSRQWSIKRSTKAIESKAVVCETSC